MSVALGLVIFPFAMFLYSFYAKGGILALIVGIPGLLVLMAHVAFVDVPLMPILVKKPFLGIQNVVLLGVYHAMLYGLGGRLVDWIRKRRCRRRAKGEAR